MKKLLLSLVVLATIFSCGKNNSVSSNSAVSGLSSSITGATEVNLATAINNNTFGASFQNVINMNPNLTFYYYKSAQAQSNCTVKWSIFTVCSSGTNSSTFSRSVTAGSVNIVNKKSELINIINQRNSIYSSGTLYYIYTTDNKMYIMDSAMPLQANPVQIQDNALKSVEFLGSYN